MKFLIKDNPISYQEIYSAIHSYMNENHGKEPSYLLIHPETRRNIIISSQDEVMGVPFNVIRMYPLKKKEEIKQVVEVCGLSLLSSQSKQQ